MNIPWFEDSIVNLIAANFLQKLDASVAYQS